MPKNVSWLEILDQMWSSNEFDFVVCIDRCCLKWYLEIHRWNVRKFLDWYTFIPKSVLKLPRIIIRHVDGTLQRNCSKIFINKE